jgi:hypothetical protein
MGRIGLGVLVPVALMHDTAVRSTPKQVNAWEDSQSNPPPPTASHPYR